MKCPPHPWPRYTGGASFLWTLLVPSVGGPWLCTSQLAGERNGKRSWEHSCPRGRGFPISTGEQGKLFPSALQTPFAVGASCLCLQSSRAGKPLHLPSPGLTGLKFIAR